MNIIKRATQQHSTGAHPVRGVRRCSQPAAQRSRSGGAVIIMVVSLMTTLVVIGLFFYNFANQERTNAEFFASTEPLEIDPDPIFDVILRQAIVGPNPNSEVQSALYGGHYSMLASILGRPVRDTTNDRLYFQPHAYNGRGATIIPRDSDSDGNPDLTWNLDTSDGVNDVAGEFVVNYGGGTQLDQDDFIVNMSPAANNGSLPAVASEFHPNTGYTYPDLNSLFLAVDDQIPTEDNSRLFRLVIPSYFRPQLLTRRRFAASASASGFEQVYEQSGATDQTRNKVLRPHQEHRALNPSTGANVARRFANSAVSANSGDKNRIIDAFPFRRDVDNDGLENEMGLFSARDINNITYEYDGDVDRDGIRDSILLDIGHDIIELPNGRQVVPLTMIKWIDNDGLLNVNAHGNLIALRERGRIINDGPFSDSNLGMSSFEVNMGLGLTADPTSNVDLDTSAADIGNIRHRIFRQHRGHFGFNPGNRQQTSNMELAMLLTGRYEVDSSTAANGGDRIFDSLPILGRYGDQARLDAFQTWASRIHPVTGEPEIRVRNTTDPMNPAPNFTGFDIPRPGVAGDDDGDRVAEFAKFLHPLDFLGRGNATLNPNPATDAPIRRTQDVNGIKVPSYDGRWMESQNNYSPNQITGALSDEPDETMVEPGLRAGSDALFPTAELFALHGSDVDHQETNLQSRLLDLASFNFRDSFNAANIRKRFTTDSWDRLEFTHRPEIGARAWEFNEWKRPDNSTFRVSARTPADLTTNQNVFFNLAFPPQFGNVASIPDVGVFQPLDPYRDNVRTLLTSRFISAPTTSEIPLWNSLRPNGALGQRLNINRLLTGISSTGSPVYARLREHLSSVGAALGADANAQLDRQQLARDIYVLMYTLCGPSNSNYATTSGIYTPEQLKQMAQFAVNLVDALDYDRVITRFEYDTDLTNGWDLDDDPATLDSSSDRQVVDGVEIQSLALSEALFVHCEQSTMNENRTEWNDNQDRSFCYIELQNVSPNDVTINEDWQILLETQTGGTTRTREAIIIADTIAVGDRYTIGSAGDDHNQNGSEPRESYMRINTNPGMGGMMETLVPSGGALDLDLITSGETTTDPTKNYRLVTNSSSATSEISTLGDFFPPAVSNDLATNGGEIRVILRRRMNGLRTPPSLGDADQHRDNPWIEVDRMEITVQPAPATGVAGFANFDASAANFTGQLNNITSIERRQSIDRLSEGDSTGNGNSGDTDNTFGEENSIQIATPTLWQPHFDRDFSSVAELLSIPLYGPADLTARLPEKSGPNTASAKLSGFYFNETLAKLQPGVAGVLFMNPDASTLSETPEIWPNGNRWYRLFEFLTVRSQNIEQLGDTSSAVAVPEVRRTPGKINLNMVRHEPVLAGLLDDPMMDRFANNPTFNATFDAGRQWFRELLRSREPVDNFLRFAPTSVLLRIPGIPGSQPMISNSHFGQLGLDIVKRYTALRQHAEQSLAPVPGHSNTTVANGTDNPFAPLDLFEARSISDVTNNTVDYHTRHRVLAKVLNNSTNRSHVYSGWIEIVFHEAHVVDDGTNQAVQVGAEAADLPRYRMFCVVDMSRLEEAFDPATGTFDFRKFVIHRQQLP